MFCVALLSVAPVLTQSSFSSASGVAGRDFPYPERLVYHVEWRLITAGNATLESKSAPDHGWHTSLNIQSAGVLSRLYRVMDVYNVATDPKFCLVRSELDAQESKRHTISLMSLEAPGKVRYEEKDLVKNSTVQKKLDVPPCTREIVGALASLRLLRLEPGTSTSLPVTDGKKVVSVRIDSQAHEAISFEGKKYATTRYEAFLFDNVLYRRKGRLFVWMTDDPDHIPVQIRLQLGFPVGTVTIQLEKQERIPG
jgi:hypothetical protein